MHMLADISTGNTGFADIMFLVGLILFLIAALLSLPHDPARPPYAWFVGFVGLAAVALGWLVL
jgi:hypothetical protein